MAKIFEVYPHLTNEQAFWTWLCAKDPDELLGTCRHAMQCLLARYVKEHSPLTVRVGFTEIAVTGSYCIAHNGEQIPGEDTLPLWMQWVRKIFDSRSDLAGMTVFQFLIAWNAFYPEDQHRLADPQRVQVFIQEARPAITLAYGSSIFLLPTPGQVSEEASDEEASSWLMTQPPLITLYGVSGEKAFEAACTFAEQQGWQSYT